MRHSLLLLGIFLVTLAAGTRADAQNYPWCAQYAGRGGGAMNCGFTSFAQCMATIQGAGGFCVANTQYQAPSEGSAPSRAHKHSSKKGS
jgi:Protein of unknown function (DUF3551)